MRIRIKQRDRYEHLSSNISAKVRAENTRANWAVSDEFQDKNRQDIGLLYQEKLS